MHGHHVIMVIYNYAHVIILTIFLEYHLVEEHLMYGDIIFSIVKSTRIIMIVINTKMIGFIHAQDGPIYKTIKLWLQPL